MPAAPKPEYTIRTKEGKLYRGILGQDIKRFVKPMGQYLRRGYEIRTPSGVWIEVWEDEVEIGGQVQHSRGIGNPTKGGTTK